MYLSRNLFLVLTVAALLSSMNIKASEPTLPNVVLIFADDLGYGDLGCYGATKVKTPNIDELAAEGRRFTDAHSASAVCTPSRYALLTGEYPVRANGGKGIWGPSAVNSELLIDTEKLTMADVFNNKGYATAALGKWHLGFGVGENDWKEPLRPGPQDLGFDYYFGLPVVNSAPPYIYVENDRIVGADPDDPLIYVGKNAKDATPITPIPPEASKRTANMFRGAVEAHKKYNDYTVGTVLAGKAVDWIAEKKDQPFFLYLATTHIHHPFTPGKTFQGSSDAELYGDFIQELDWMVGEVMNSLEKHGLSDNTLVIFTSDNGGMMNLGGRNAVKAGHKMNGDLLGFKFGAWEGGHRIPFIAKWPGKIDPGSKSDQLICNVDMLATFTALTGQDSSVFTGKDSINVLPALLENPEEPIRNELLLAARSTKHLSIRKGKWMYIPAKGSGGFRGSKPHQHAWGGPPAVELVGGVNSDIEDGKIRTDAPPAQLYDLESDVNQTKNLYSEFPEVVQEMETLLKQYRTTSVSMPLWQGRGRIAISSDGNHHDHDDWAATPLTLALLAARGMQDRLVLYTYSDHVWESGGYEDRGYREMKISALEGKELFGFQATEFMAAVDDPEKAYDAMAAAINASSEEDPLFIIGAGPMQVIGEGVKRSDISKRKYVTVISHSTWNNRHSDLPGKDDVHRHEGWTFEEMQKAFSGEEGGSVRFVQIKDQNGGDGYPGLNTDRKAYDWLKTSHARDRAPYEKGSWDWLYARQETCIKNKGLNFDPSDAGMVVFLLTGIDKTDPSMVRKIMENPVR